MGGEHFDHQQWHIKSIAEMIEEDLKPLTKREIEENHHGWACDDVLEGFNKVEDDKYSKYSKKEVKTQKKVVKLLNEVYEIVDILARIGSGDHEFDKFEEIDKRLKSIRCKL